MRNRVHELWDEDMINKTHSVRWRGYGSREYNGIGYGTPYGSGQNPNGYTLGLGLGGGDSHGSKDGKSSGFGYGSGNSDGYLQGLGRGSGEGYGRYGTCTINGRGE